MSAAFPRSGQSSAGAPLVIPEDLINELTRACEDRQGRPIAGGREIRFRCPVHAPDVHPSARWNPELAVWRCDACTAGGGAYELAGLLGIETRRDVLRSGPVITTMGRSVAAPRLTTAPLRSEREAPMASSVAAIYQYSDTLRVARYEPKAFRPQHLVNGQWVVGKGTERWPLYRQQDIPHEMDWAVHVTEGERDADTLAALGWISVSPGSATNPWLQEWTDVLTGRNVVVHVDNDDPGRRRGKAIAGQLMGRATSVRIVQYPEQGPGGDVTDFLATHTPAELEDLVDSTRPLRVASVPEPSPDHAASPDQAPTSVRPMATAIVTSMADVDPRPIDWAWKGWLACGKLTVIAGQPGDGKSTITLALAAAFSRGDRLPDGQTAPIGNTLLVLAEDDLADTVRPRLDVHRADVTRIHAIKAIRDPDNRERFVSLADHVPQMREVILERDINVVVIDPFTAFLPKADRNAEGDVRDALMPLIKMAEETGVALLAVMHVGKASGQGRKPLQTLLGSTAFGAMARLVWMVVDLPEDQQPAKREDGTRDTHKLLQVIKSNISQRPSAWRWMRPMDGSIQWLGRSEMSIEDVLAAGETSVKPIERAKEFLTVELAERARFAQDLLDRAKEQGIAEKTLRRAQVDLNIQAFRPPGTGSRWIWHRVNQPTDVCDAAAAPVDGEDGHLSSAGGEDGHFPDQVAIFPQTEDGHPVEVTIFPAESEDGHSDQGDHLPGQPPSEGEDGHLRESTRAPAQRADPSEGPVG